MFIFSLNLLHWSTTRYDGTTTYYVFIVVLIIDKLWIEFVIGVIMCSNMEIRIGIYNSKPLKHVSTCMLVDSFDLQENSRVDSRSLNSFTSHFLQFYTNFGELFRSKIPLITIFNRFTASKPVVILLIKEYVYPLGTCLAWS